MYQNPYINNPYINMYQQPTYNTYQQPQQQIQPQQQMFTQPSLSGRVVTDYAGISANDVPMDGSIAVFPKNDLSEVQIRSWKPDGTIGTILYRKVETSAQTDVKAEETTLNELREQLQRIEEAVTKKPTTRKKETADD